MIKPYDNKVTYILLFAIFLFSYSYFVHWIGGWNESSRLDLVYSIVERHSFNIDPYHQNTGDKAFFQGHYYSDKAPGLSFFAVPFYILIKIIAAGFKLPIVFNAPDSLIVFYLLTLLTVGLPSALAGVLFYKFIGYFTDNKIFQLAASVGYSLCTLVFPYSTLFIGHQFSAALAFSAFFLAFYMKQKNFNKPLALFLTGFLAGYAVISEYPSVIIAVALFFYILSFLKAKKNIIFFILGAVSPALLLMYYNRACFGNPFLLSYKFEASNPAFEGMKEGFFGITSFSFKSLYGITFGPYRGLYRTSPLLLLSIPGFYYFFRRKEYRPEFYFSLFVTSVFIVLNSSYYMWYGGATMGPRHIIPILPFMSLGLIFFLERFRGKRWVISLFRILLALSFLMMLFGTAVDPRLPPANIDVNSFIFLRLLFGSYTPNSSIFYHSFNLGALLFIYLARFLFMAPFILTLLPMLILFLSGIHTLVKYSEQI